MPIAFQKFERNSASSIQLATIDTLKGICMLGIFFVHFVVAWHAADWPALARFVAYVLDFVGPVMFATMSVVGHMISLRAGASAGEPPYSARRMLRVSFLVFFAEYLNIITLWRLGVLLITAWNVVLAIAVFALVLPQMLRLKRVIRLAIVAGIMLVYYPISNWMVATIGPFNHDINGIQMSVFQDPVAVIYWIFFCHDMMSPIFSWLLVPLLVSVIFEPFATKHAAGWPAMQGDDKSVQSRQSSELKNIALWGIALVAIAVTLSVQLIPDYVPVNNQELDMPDAYFTWLFSDGMFPFLIRHTPQYFMYTIGLACILFASFARFQFVASKHLLFESYLNAIGKLSLTAFALSLYIFLIPVKLPLPTFCIVIVPMEVVVLVCFWAWQVKGRRRGSLEWFMDIYVNGALVMMKRRTTRPEQVE